MTSRSFVFSVAAACALAACSSSHSPAAGSDAGSNPPLGDINLPVEQGKLGGVGTSATILESGKATQELFVHEDPTINVSESAAENASNVAAQLKSSLSSCASASVTQASGSATVSVTFGSDCTVNGVSFSGSVAATVSKASAGITVAFTFTNLDVNGTTVNGTASETTANGTTYSSAVNLKESDGTTVTFTGTFVLDSGDQGVTMNGTGVYTESGVPAIDYTSTNVHHTFGECYASSGSISYSTTVVGKSGKSYTTEETITFSSSTPTTGEASATIGSTTTTVTLPAHGKCGGGDAG